MPCFDLVVKRLIKGQIFLYQFFNILQRISSIVIWAIKAPATFNDVSVKLSNCREDVACNKSQGSALYFMLLPPPFVLWQFNDQISHAWDELGPKVPANEIRAVLLQFDGKKVEKNILLRQLHINIVLEFTFWTTGSAIVASGQLSQLTSWFGLSDSLNKYDQSTDIGFLQVLPYVVVVFSRPINLWFGKKSELDCK